MTKVYTNCPELMLLLVKLGYTQVLDVKKSDLVILDSWRESVSAATWAYSLGIPVLKVGGNMWDMLWQVLSQEILYGKDLCSGVSK